MQIDKAVQIVGRRHEAGDQQRIDGKARRTSHQRYRDDRGEPRTPRADYSCGHDGGHRAGVAGQKRDEGLSGQTAEAEQAVHEEGCARQVAAILQKQHHGEEDHDLWQEHHHRAHPGPQSVHQQAGQSAGWQNAEGMGAGAFKQPADGVHKGRGPCEYGLKDGAHHAEKHQHPQNRVIDGAFQPALARAGVVRNREPGAIQPLIHLPVAAFRLAGLQAGCASGSQGMTARFGQGFPRLGAGNVEKPLLEFAVLIDDGSFQRR